MIRGAHAIVSGLWQIVLILYEGEKTCLFRKEEKGTESCINSQGIVLPISVLDNMLIYLLPIRSLDHVIDVYSLPVSLGQA